MKIFTHLTYIMRELAVSFNRLLYSLQQCKLCSTVCSVVFWNVTWYALLQRHCISVLRSLLPPLHIPTFFYYNVCSAMIKHFIQWPNYITAVFLDLATYVSLWVVHIRSLIDFKNRTPVLLLQLMVYATRNGLDGPGIESGGGCGKMFCSHLDRPWGPPSLLYNGYRVSFPGVKRPGRGVDTHPHLVPELYLYSPSGPSWPVLGRTFFTNGLYKYKAANLCKGMHFVMKAWTSSSLFIQHCIAFHHAWFHQQCSARRTEGEYDPYISL
jgi:hypothetical protein